MKSQSQKTVHLSSFADAWKNIRRAPYQAWVAILALGCTFYAVTIFALVAIGSEQIIKHFEGKPQIIAFFKVYEDPPEGETVDQIRTQLQQTGKVKELIYVSQEEALQIYRQQNQEDPELLEMVTANILPASIEVSTNSPEDQYEIYQLLESYQSVDEVIYQQDVIKELTKWTGSIRKIGIENVGVLGVLSFLFIVVIMGMKVSQKRAEIRILRLVGATSGYIVRPYLLEGLFYGFIGAILGWGAAYTRILYATPFLIELFTSLGGLPITLSPIKMITILAAELCIAILLTIFASWVAVSRYLNRYQ